MPGATGAGIGPSLQVAGADQPPANRREPDPVEGVERGAGARMVAEDIGAVVGMQRRAAIPE